MNWFQLSTSNWLMIGYWVELYSTQVNEGQSVSNIAQVSTFLLTEWVKTETKCPPLQEQDCHFFPSVTESHSTSCRAAYAGLGWSPRRCAMWELPLESGKYHSIVENSIIYIVKKNWKSASRPVILFIYWNVTGSKLAHPKRMWLTSEFACFTLIDFLWGSYRYTTQYPSHTLCVGET